jgi:hypothetical protein
LSQEGGEKLFEKYKRFKFDKENEHSRRCPTCDTAQINESGMNSSGKINMPTMMCVKCGEEYCYYHSNSHPGISCEEYEKKEEEANKLNSQFIRKFAKPCPQCNMLVSKSGGCNQMKCTNCGCYFCWLCNAKVDAGTFPTHYQWWNLAGCPNMQMNESIAPSNGDVFRAKGLSVLQLIFLTAPSLALSIVSSILCCFCLDLAGETKKEKVENCMSLWGNILTVLIAIPIGLAALGALVVLFPVWCVFYSIYATIMSILNPSSLTRKRSTGSHGSRGSWGSLKGIINGRSSGDGEQDLSAFGHNGESDFLKESDVSVEVMEAGFSPGLAG